MKRSFLRLIRIALLLLVALFPIRGLSAEGPLYVILWFDTEDYILPADDDATKRLCEMLTERGIRATFKIVGEKARVLQSRGRNDVIAALKKHDIAYHANFHSVHPTPTEYLADCGWMDGIEEFIRREGAGAADVRRIFDRQTLSCYGQPGSSWAPQAVAALKKIGVAPQGVPCYVDEGTHVGIDGAPFWYASVLNVYHMSPNYTRMELHDPAEVEPGKKAFSAIADRLRSRGGGLISIFYHPCEWVHREFWDGVNFRRGANPPREEWKLPPQRTPEETDGAFQRFGQYIDHIRSVPGVKWVTAGELPALYPDLAQRDGVTSQELALIADRILKSEQGLDYLKLGPKVFSLADQFELLTSAVADTLNGNTVSFPMRTSGLMGPDAPPPATSVSKMSRLAFRDTVRDVRDFISREHRVPARVFVGADAVAPADFLIAMARALAQRPTAGASDALEPGHNTKVLPERYVAEDTPGLFGGWVIHKENFRAPKLMELARLQAWTLKPAVRRDN